MPLKKYVCHIYVLLHCYCGVLKRTHISIAQKRKCNLHLSWLCHVCIRNYAPLMPQISSCTYTRQACQNICLVWSQWNPHDQRYWFICTSHYWHESLNKNICLPLFTIMFHCTDSVVYIQATHCSVDKLKKKTNKQEGAHLFTMLLWYMYQQYICLWNAKFTTCGNYSKCTSERNVPIYMPYKKSLQLKLLSVGWSTDREIDAQPHRCMVYGFSRQFTKIS